MTDIVKAMQVWGGQESGKVTALGPNLQVVLSGRPNRHHRDLMSRYSDKEEETSVVSARIPISLSRRIANTLQALHEKGFRTMENRNDMLRDALAWYLDYVQELFELDDGPLAAERQRELLRAEIVHNTQQKARLVDTVVNLRTHLTDLMQGRDYEEAWNTVVSYYRGVTAFGSADKYWKRAYLNAIYDDHYVGMVVEFLTLKGYVLPGRAEVETWMEEHEAEVEE